MTIRFHTIVLRLPSRGWSIRTRRPTAAALLGAACMASGCAPASPTMHVRHLITKDEERRANSDPNVEISGSLHMVGGYDEPYIFGISSKGNGIVEFGSIVLHVYDGHNDGEMFEPPLLDVQVVTNADGECEGLRLTGTVVMYDEKGNQVIGREPVEFTCHYDASRHIFVIDKNDARVIR